MSAPVDPRPWVVGSYNGDWHRSAMPNWGMATNHKLPRHGYEGHVCDAYSKWKETEGAEWGEAVPGTACGRASND